MSRPSRLVVGHRFAIGIDRRRRAPGGVIGCGTCVGVDDNDAFADAPTSDTKRTARADCPHVST